MARPTKYDVVLQGKKIAGAAQRQKKQGYLHQGTISLKAPCVAQLEAWLLPGSQVLQAMQSYTFSLLEDEADAQKMENASIKIQDLLYQSLIEQSYKTNYATT